MKKQLSLSTLLISALTIGACTDAPVETEAKVLVEDSVESVESVDQGFSVATAKENLNFSKDQYLKMIDHVANKRHLNLTQACKDDPSMTCVPRSEEHGGIYMEQSAKWTNGFFPGVLWKVLASKEHISTLSEEQESALLDAAKFYQATLFSEAERGSTHDLGFILYDSFGEALNYASLDDETRSAYTEALVTGRETLATRYTDEVGLIRSWDWVPQMRVGTIENGEKVVDLYDLSSPWTYPVIVDNMMNLEFLFDSDSARYHEIAFNHAKNTSLNHYFYDESDAQKEYPISFHVFDYGAFKPGNWQGIGNVSAWARGQGWSLYGFATVVEAMDKANIDLAEYPDFKEHLGRVFNTVEHYLQDEAVPYWDYFATRENAFEYAENIGDDTAVYHHILGLCSERIEPQHKPYMGYRPMTLDASMLTDESLASLEGKMSWYGEPVVQGDKLFPCGTKPYADTHVKIPRDTSAAAIYAAAMYRIASHTKDAAFEQKALSLADRIMDELTQKYRTDRAANGRPNSHEFGFVLAEATGDMGNAGEIDTPIIYGDFYFIEANIRKIEYEQSKKQIPYLAC